MHPLSSPHPRHAPSLHSSASSGIGIVELGSTGEVSTHSPSSPVQSLSPVQAVLIMSGVVSSKCVFSDASEFYSATVVRSWRVGFSWVSVGPPNVMVLFY